MSISRESVKQRIQLVQTNGGASKNCNCSESTMRACCRPTVQLTQFPDYCNEMKIERSPPVEACYGFGLLNFTFSAFSFLCNAISFSPAIFVALVWQLFLLAVCLSKSCHSKRSRKNLCLFVSCCFFYSLSLFIVFNHFSVQFMMQQMALWIIKRQHFEFFAIQINTENQRIKSKTKHEI